MRNNQLIFKFSSNGNKIIKENLIVGEFNKNVIDFLFNQKEWYFNVVYIYGNHKVGKSYITKLFLQDFGGKEITLKDIQSIEHINQITQNYQLLLLEDLDNLTKDYEEMLFYLYNLVITNNIKLIITSTKSLNELDIKLKDLQSRLFNTMILKINEPDEQVAKPLLFKMFQDKQLKINMKIINYILSRAERKAESYFNIVNIIEDVTATTQKNISIKIVKSILEKN